LKTVQGKNENKLSVDLKNLNEGVYLINIFSADEKIYSVKLLRFKKRYDKFTKSDLL
jgi:translation elongation factor P/translation initiation factor 5A